MTDTDLQVTSFRAVRKFIGYVAIYDHDLLGTAPDVVEVRVDTEPGLLFRGKPENIISFAVAPGFRFSWVNFGVFKTGDIFYVSSELTEWVAEVLALIKANDIRFTHISQ